MLITTKGLVIKVMDIRDNDRLITILTADLGLIKAFVSGAKKASNKNHANTSLFCYSDFSLSKSGDTYKVKESILISSFFNIGTDILLKLERSTVLECGIFAGRNPDSEGIRIAR